MIPEQNEWQIKDSDGLIMPWYTHPALEWIKNNIPKDVTVLEIGGGYSTLWWRRNGSLVNTYEDNFEWAEYLGQCVLLQMDKVKDYLKGAGLYDVVIPDSDGDRLFILDAFQHCKKYFIVDNWQQPSACVYPKEIVDYLYQNTKQQLIFKQPNHPDWQTAIFIL